MRICKDCGIEKPLEEFYKVGKWYRNRCKKCQDFKFNPPTGKSNTGRFKKGQKSWNKGTKGATQSNKTTFKKGNTIGKETRFKSGLSSVGKVFTKGFTPWNKGKNLDGNCRECISNKQWRKSVLERDLYKCKQCSSDIRLHVHHVKNWEEYPELRFDINNGITLCNSCHSRLHRKIDGFKKEQLTWNKGKKCSEETKKKISESLKRYYRESSNGNNK